MPNKKFCKKCGDKHLPPTGRNCVQTLSSVCHTSSSPASSVAKGASHPSAAEASTGEQTTVLQQEILRQLQCVNNRLDSVEQDLVTVKGTANKQTHKISSFDKSNVSVSEVSMSESDSSSDESLIPSLNVLKSKKSIQRKVDQRLKQLQDDSAVKSGSTKKLLGHNKIAWPQDTVLGGHSRQRVTYDQLSLTQWVQGFAKNIIEENCRETKEHMLLSDATDFSWHNAKAAHALLLCDMERGAVSWKETSKIDRIRRAHAQKHLQNSKPWAKNSDTSASKKPWFCKPFQTGLCTINRDHESNGK